MSLLLCAAGAGCSVWRHDVLHCCLLAWCCVVIAREPLTWCLLCLEVIWRPRR